MHGPDDSTQLREEEMEEHFSRSLGGLMRTMTLTQSSEEERMGLLLLAAGSSEEAGDEEGELRSVGGLRDLRDVCRIDLGATRGVVPEGVSDPCIVGGNCQSFEIASWLVGVSA